MESDNDLSILANVKARVDKITIDGLKKTKDNLMVNMLQNKFKNIHNFQDLLVEAYEFRERLSGLGVFNRIEITIDTNRADATSTGYEIIYKVEEKGPLQGKISTMIDNNDGSLVLKSDLLNILGGAEKLSAEYQVSKNSQKGVNVEFKAPIRPWTYYNPIFTSAVYQNSGERPWSGFHQTDRGVHVDLSLNSFADINHNFRWAGIWREIKVFGPSFQIREQSGHSLKSSIYHTMTIDRRELSPYLDYIVKLNQEYAGLGGDTSFIKQEFLVSNRMPLIGNISVEGSLKAGIINSSCGIADRFFLGGPMNLRGFKMNGVGPHSEGNALGASTYWITGLHLYAPLPFKNSSESWLKTHFFLNAGNIGNFPFKGDHVKYFNNMVNRVRLSVGFGFVVSFPNFVRLELNYCFPLQHQPGRSEERRVGKECQP